MEEKINEILKCTNGLKKIAKDLYLKGCEPEDIIIYSMNCYINAIENILKENQKND